VRYLLKKGVNPNLPDNKGETEIFKHLDNPNIVSDFIQNKADVNASRRDNTTVLMVAAEIGNSQTIQKLVMDGGAQVEAKDKLGKTALHYAALAGKKEAVQEKLLKVTTIYL